MTKAVDKKAGSAEKVEKPDESPYGERPVFRYQPDDGSDPIVFPRSEVLWDEVDGVKPLKFLWKLRQLNDAYQTFSFMDRAHVPLDIQERVIDLPDNERRKFFEAWFSDVSAPPEVEAGVPPES